MKLVEEWICKANNYLVKIHCVQEYAVEAGVGHDGGPQVVRGLTFLNGIFLKQLLILCLI